MCAYRSCQKGPGGTKGTFDRIHRSLKSGDYFCDQRCRAAEQRARNADEAWRPADWLSKPIDWRIIGGELLSREGHMTNEELAERLDKSRILQCPYADDWETAFGRKKRAVDYLWGIRNWVHRTRPGRSLPKK